MEAFDSEPIDGEIRLPAVAGAFYPDIRGELAAMVDTLLRRTDARKAAPKSMPVASPRAVVSPHAGYVYSGSIAAEALVGLHSSQRPVIFLLGPPHRVPVSGFALPSALHFSTPLGIARVERGIFEELAQAPDVEIDGRAHAREHSLEVQLPFLQALFGKTLRIVPLLVGDVEPERVADLLEPFWARSSTAFVFSSDLSHFEDYEMASRHDRRTAMRLLEDGGGRLKGEDACGYRALNGLSVLAARKGLQGSLLRLENSGDHSGPWHRVVGYGALAFRERTS